MTVSEFKKIGRLLKEAYKELEQEALKADIDIFGDQYKELQDKTREALLSRMGFTLEEYKLAKENTTAIKQTQLDDTAKSKLETLLNTHIPTKEEILAIAHEVAQEYIVPPQITNEIVKETIVEKPQIVKETKIEQTVVEYDDAPLKKELDSLKKKSKTTADSIREEFKNYFSQNLRKNIDIMGMEAFRKLAMGLQSQIDELGGEWGSITGTLSDQTDLQTALDLKEDLANKSTSVSTDGTSDTKYPSVKAIKDYADSLVVGLLDYRGGYDASVNTYPTSGGSGTSGAVKKGDLWIISTAGTLGGSAIQIGDSIIANTDTPGQTASNWNALNANVTYVPEDVSNKVTSLSVSSTDTQYPSAKLTYDQLALKATDSAVLKKDGSVSLTANWNADGAGTLFVDKTNSRVGIGTGTPQVLLDVDGDSVIGRVQSSSGASAVAVYNEDATSFVGFQKRGTSATGNMSLPAGSSEVVSSASPLGVYTTGTNYLALGTNNTERLRVDSSGNVGIGNSGPVYKLDVTGAVTTTARLQTSSTDTDTANLNGALLTFQNTSATDNNMVGMMFRDSGGTAVSAIISQTTDHTAHTGSLHLMTRNASGTMTKRVTIDTSGNVGIGVTPSYPLHVAGSQWGGSNATLDGSALVFGTTVGIRERSGTGTGISGNTFVSQLFQGNSGGGYFEIFNRSTSYGLVLGTNTLERMRIDQNGNIGFNATSFGTSAVGVIAIGNATTVPASSPTGMGQLYVESGALKYRGSSGTVTTIAVA